MRRVTTWFSKRRKTLSFRAYGAAGEASLIDEVDSLNGIVADIKGIGNYAVDQELLPASSQGNDSFAAYDLNPAHQLVLRFRGRANGDIHGYLETDGIDSTAIPLGSMFPGIRAVNRISS